jgi:WD40 repeat protein
VHRLHADGSGRAAFSPDGRHLVLASVNSAPTLWDVATGNLLRTFDIAASLSASFTPDSRRVLLGGELKPAMLFDVESGKAIPGLQFAYADHYTFSPDGKRLLAHSTENVRLFDLTGGRLLAGIEGYPPYETQAVFGSDSQTWIAGGYGRTLTVRDVETGGIVRRFGSHSGPITALAPFAVGPRLVSASADGTVQLWNAASGALLATFVATENGEWLIMTPEGFFSASADGGDLVKLVRGMEVYPVDRARDQLQRPDLVAEKIAGDPRGLVRDARSRLDLAKAIAEPR